MPVHANAGRDVVEEHHLLIVQLARIEWQPARGRERQQIARRAQRFPRRLAPPRLKRLERSRAGEVEGLRAREPRAPHGILNAGERAFIMSALERLTCFFAEAADVPPANAKCDVCYIFSRRRARV